AEDGIRDRNVTGVQTCALPICAVGSRGRRLRLLLPSGWRGSTSSDCTQNLGFRARWDSRKSTIKIRHCQGRPCERKPSTKNRARSEERRVGKEGRSWSVKSQ